MDAPTDLHCMKVVLSSHKIDNGGQVHILLDVKIQNDGFQLLPSSRKIIT